MSVIKNVWEKVFSLFFFLIYNLILGVGFTIISKGMKLM